MANTNEEPEVEEVDNLPEVEEGQEDTTDWKAEALKYQGIAKRLKTKSERVAVEEPQKSSVKPDKVESGELDYGQKAFLIANGVKGADENALVQAEIAKYREGTSLDSILESIDFQAKLKDLRETKTTNEAIPRGTKRTGQSTKDSVDYWVAKGELPPASERELRTQVVNARIKAERQDNQFTQNPVVGKL